MFNKRNAKHFFPEVDEEEFEEYEDNGEIPALPRDLKHIPYGFDRLLEKESLDRASKFYQIANTRRTLRFFSPDPVPKEIIHQIIRAAGMQILT